MTYATKGIINAACCGAFKKKSTEEARQLIEDLSKCNYKAPYEASGSNNILKGSGVIKLNRMTVIEAKLDALMNKLGNNERRMHTALEVRTLDEVEKRNSAKEGLTYEGSYQVEKAQYLNANRSYTFKPNLNLPTQRRSNSFEDQMLAFLRENKRLMNIHEQKFAKLAAF